MLSIEDDYKRSNYPLGIIIDTITNDLGEVTQVLVKKGKAGQVNKFHISMIIPLFESNGRSGGDSYENSGDGKFVVSRPKCKAAIISEEKTKKNSFPMTHIYVNTVQFFFIVYENSP